MTDCPRHRLVILSGIMVEDPETEAREFRVTTRPARFRWLRRCVCSTGGTP